MKELAMDAQPDTIREAVGIFASADDLERIADLIDRQVDKSI